jgi:hypothetical protein
VPVADEISPESYGQQFIGLTLSTGQGAAQQTPRQFQTVTVDVDYSKCLPADVVLPLEFTVTSESGASVFRRQIFRKTRPPSLAFIPREGGAHLVRLAESNHNRWFGALQIDVAGEKVSDR